MSTPTNHTSITSFFNEWEEESEECQTQISSASTIENSNMFAEVSAHSRYSSLSNIFGRSRAASGGQSLLGPLEEGQEGSEVPVQSLSKTSSDAENHGDTSNQMLGDQQGKGDTSISTRHTTLTTTANSNVNSSGGGILKPSRFCSTSATFAPPPPPPSNPPPAKATAKRTLPKGTGQRLRQSQEQTQPYSIPVLSVTTVLAHAKSEETDSAFLNSLYTNTTATTPIDVNNHQQNFALNTPLAADPSQRTSATFGMIPGNVPSETIHTSNLRVTTADGGFHAREADRMAAWAIHIALLFFCALTLACVLISFTVIRKYGFITLIGLFLMVTFVGFLAIFVDQTILSKNPKLRPIRQKIAAVVHAAQGLLVEEYQLLIRDWNEHLLLTQGEEQYEAYAAGEGGTTSTHPMNRRLPPPSIPQGRKRSTVFKIIKPFLGIRKRLFRGKKRPSGVAPPSVGTYDHVISHSQPQQLRQQPSPPQDYEPPEVAGKAAVV